MAVESEADRLAMLRDFGSTAVVGNRTLTGIFDAEYLAIDASGYDIESRTPMLHARTSDLPAIVNGTTVCRVGGVSYTVVESQPDGTGMTMLRLRAP